jgi:hypothetical protein
MPFSDPTTVDKTSLGEMSLSQDGKNSGRTFIRGKIKIFHFANVMTFKIDFLRQVPEPAVLQ